MKCSDAGLAMVEEFEGCSLVEYPDVGGLGTIGIGHLIKKGEQFKQPMSHADAVALLCNDMEDTEAAIDGLVDVPLSQNQFDALCSLVFNIGRTNFMTSTLLRKLNAGDYKGAGEEFQRWCKVNGKNVSGLLRRRIAEQMLWEKPS